MVSDESGTHSYIKVHLHITQYADFARARALYRVINDLADLCDFVKLVESDNMGTSPSQVLPPPPVTSDTSETTGKW